MFGPPTLVVARLMLSEYFTIFPCNICVLEASKLDWRSRLTVFFQMKAFRLLFSSLSGVFLGSSLTM